MNRTFRSAAIGGIILSACASAALAVPIATFTINGGTGGFSSSYHLSGSLIGTTPTLTGSGGTDGVGSAFASSLVTPGPDPIATASTQTVANGYSAVGFSVVTYYVELTGGTASQVKIDIQGAYTQDLAFSGAGTASASMVIGSQGQPYTFEPFEVVTPSDTSYDVFAQTQFGSLSHQAPSIGLNSTVPFSTTSWLQVGVVYPVTLSVESTAQGSDSPNSCSIDPLITIDPAFLAGDPGATLVVSDGFAVPEPSGLALAGLAAILSLAGRRGG